PIKTLSEANLRGKRRDKIRRVQSQRHDARAHAIDLAGYLKVQTPCVVALTRITPKRAADKGDNQPAALKAIRDGIADWLEIDDGCELIDWHYPPQEKGEYGVRVQIYERAWLVHRIVPAAEPANDVRAEDVRRAGGNGRRRRSPGCAC